ncbi:MAG TPA: tetratricopeptide repeat protein [Pirellulales bacterium]|nr:tetratricopeptide repeat protein [Pirellulales bacterium]
MRARSYFTSAILLAARLTFPSGDVLAGKAEDQYAVAAGHYKQKRWKFAADEFQTFLADYPQHTNAAKARFYLGESLLQSRRFDEATQAFRTFVEQAPNDRLAKKARFRAGEATYLAGHFEQAKAEFESFARELPDDPLNAYVLFYLGDIALRGGDHQTAELLFVEALKRYPQGPLQDDCRFGLAQAQEHRGQNEDARRLYLALAGKPSSPWAAKAQFRLGGNFYAAGEYEQALGCFQELLEHPRFAGNPLRVQAALAAGESLYQLKQFDVARQQFESLLEAPSVLVEAHYWLGLTQSAQKDFAAAAVTLLIAAEQAAGDARLAAAARFHAGEALLQAGKPLEAQAQYDLVLKNWPNGEFAEKSLLGRMQVALATGDHKQVDALAAQFSERYPMTQLRRRVDRVVGRSLVERKDYPAAAAVFEKLLAAESDSTGSTANNDRCLLAAAYIGQSRYDDALKVIATITLAPEPAGDERQLWIDVQRQQAAALVGLEQYADAAQRLEQLLAIKPDAKTNIWCRAELAVCLSKTGDLQKAKEVFGDLASSSAEGEVVPAAMLAMADAALAQKDAAWAADLYEQLAEQPSDFRARALWGLARSRVSEGDAARAVTALDRMLTDYPGNVLAPEAALGRGQLSEQLKDDEAALKSYRLVIDTYTTSPQLPQAMLAAARIEQRLRRPQEAITLYRRLDEQFPNLPEHDAVLYEWAWALRATDEAAKSEEVFERLRVQMPHGKFWADAVYRMAERAYAIKDYPRAEQLANELIAGEPGPQVLPHALYLAAQIAAAQDQWRRVGAPLERLMAEFPDNPIVPLARYLVAESAYREGQYDQAAELFRELAESMPDRKEKWAPMVPLRRAQILAQQREWHDALELASQIETDFPDCEQQYEVDYLIGRCQASLGRFDDARAAYGRVVASEVGAKTETAAKAQWMTGETYFHQKNYEAALREYLRVDILYAYPVWQAAALFEAAKCHEHLGEPKQAAELYEKLIKSYPESPLAKDAVERLKMKSARAEVRTEK